MKVHLFCQIRLTLLQESLVLTQTLLIFITSITAFEEATIEEDILKEAHWLNKFKISCQRLEYFLMRLVYFVIFLSSRSSLFSRDSILVSILANFESKFLCNFPIVPSVPSEVALVAWSVCWLMIICLAALTMFCPTSSTLQSEMLKVYSVAQFYICYLIPQQFCDLLLG